MRIQASKIRYQGTRKDQQDNVSVFQVHRSKNSRGLAVGILTDGIGGLDHGALASAFVNNTVSQGIKERCGAGEDGPLTELLTRIAVGANDELRSFKEDNGLGACGTTLLIAAIDTDRLHFVSIGDSIIWTLDEADRITRINREHVTEFKGRSVLSSAVLGEDIAEIDHGEISLKRLGIRQVLLSSDGIWTLENHQIIAQLTRDVENKLQSIVDEVAGIERASQDNLSMILFEIGED